MKSKNNPQVQQLLEKPYLLPYQKKWVEDTSKFKICEKSRRVGMTYVQALECVRFCLDGRGDCWISSADESAAKEFIIYAAKWAKIYSQANSLLGEDSEDLGRGVKSYSITFPNGYRITALSSNPKAFRSKGGMVVLDEFAFHDDANELWKAARPAITWGFPIRILSTHNGKNCLYYKFIEKVKLGKLSWSYHHIDILEAVEQGVADRILNKQLTQEERLNWIEEVKADTGDELVWQQEYLCNPVDESTAYLSYELINSCTTDGVVWSNNSQEIRGELFIGFDIARKKDLSVITLIEKIGSTFYLRAIYTLRDTKFSQQRDLLYSLLSSLPIRRACIDATGIGMQMAEEAQIKFGNHTVESIIFTATVKEDLAVTLKRNFEERSIYIPSDEKLKEDLHSVKKLTTVAGNVRFDAAHSDAGHADHFWALALAIHAGSNNTRNLWVESTNFYETSNLLKGF